MWQEKNELTRSFDCSFDLHDAKRTVSNFEDKTMRPGGGNEYRVLTNAEFVDNAHDASTKIDPSIMRIVLSIIFAVLDCQHKLFQV
jgi:hypothetical protein